MNKEGQLRRVFHRNPSSGARGDALFDVIFGPEHVLRYNIPGRKLGDNTSSNSA